MIWVMFIDFTISLDNNSIGDNCQLVKSTTGFDCVPYKVTNQKTFTFDKSLINNVL